MAKYDPLQQWLAAQTTSEVQMSFRQIEELVDDPLPESARTHQAWWSGTPEGNPDIVQKQAWAKAGYQVAELDLPHESVTFRRVR